ncbi:MAG: Rieske (2Fe-2S) protein, partial [Chloroflexi bacterium]|nr:Rieske (2Fe-2S) protein [Chloroflexota bacterium]
MVTTEENTLFTQVGPGTPCGTLMRQYWHPIAATAQLIENPVKKIRILGEDLVLFKDRQGKLGLIGPRCLHRYVDLQYGIPEETGLRCPYHGWLYDADGKILETPLEPADSHMKDFLQLRSCHVEEM